MSVKFRKFSFILYCVSSKNLISVMLSTDIFQMSLAYFFEFCEFYDKIQHLDICVALQEIIKSKHSKIIY